MLMRKEMLRTIFVIPLTLGTKTKLKRRVVKLCSSAYRALMMRASFIHRLLSHLRLKLLSALHLMRRIALHIPRREEKDDEV